MISVPNVTKIVPNVMIVPFCYTLLEGVGGEYECAKCL